MAIEEPESSNHMLANHIVLGHLHNTSLYATLNEDSNGPSIVIYSGFRPASYIDVSVDPMWHGKHGAHPHKHILLSQERARFIRKRLDIEYWILRRDHSTALIIGSHLIIPDHLDKEASIYKIPTSLCIHRDI